LGYYMTIWYIWYSLGNFFRFWYQALRKIWQPCFSRPWKYGRTTENRTKRNLPFILRAKPSCLLFQTHFCMSSAS
jgi:hypothetical protein